MILKIKRLHPDAVLPAYAKAGDAGLDLSTYEDVTLVPDERKAVGTGLSFELDDGYVALMWGRSGLAVKNGIAVLGGVIDAGYRGEYKVILHNVSDQPVVFAKGDRVAQLLIQKVERPEIVEVQEVSQSERGADGFGSTGVR